jgi:hypothetical protein
MEVSDCKCSERGRQLTARKSVNADCLSILSIRGIGCGGEYLTVLELLEPHELEAGPSQPELEQEQQLGLEVELSGHLYLTAEPQFERGEMSEVVSYIFVS